MNVKLLVFFSLFLLIPLSSAGLWVNITSPTNNTAYSIDPEYLIYVLTKEPLEVTFNCSGSANKGITNVTGNCNGNLGESVVNVQLDLPTVEGVNNWVAYVVNGSGTKNISYVTFTYTPIIDSACSDLTDSFTNSIPLVGLILGILLVVSLVGGVVGIAYGGFDFNGVTFLIISVFGMGLLVIATIYIIGVIGGC
jgi:hypothetical protein